MSDLFQYAQEHHSQEFGGATFNEKRDGSRLKKQLDAVRSIMLRPNWPRRDTWIWWMAVAGTGQAPTSSSSKRLP